MKLALDRAAPRDLVALRRSLAELPGHRAQRSSAAPTRRPRGARRRRRRRRGSTRAPSLHDLLARAVADDPPARASDGGVIRDGFDAALDEARELLRGGQRLIVELEARLRETSAIASLKLRYTRVFGWYIEVTRSHVDKAPPRVAPQADDRRPASASPATSSTTLADKLAHAEERAGGARGRALRRPRARPRGRRTSACAPSRARLAAWDVASALAEVAHRDDWVRPDVDDSLELVHRRRRGTRWSRSSPRPGASSRTTSSLGAAGDGRGRASGS